MLKKTIQYIDYNGNEVTEDFYFNLTSAEIAEMELENAVVGKDGKISGGMQSMLNDVVESGSGKRIIEVFKDIISRSYGVKTEDGKRFIKSKELYEQFLQTEAYSAFFMELVTNADYAADFIRQIVPANLSESDKPTQPVSAAAHIANQPPAKQQTAVDSPHKQYGV